MPDQWASTADHAPASDGGWASTADHAAVTPATTPDDSVKNGFLASAAHQLSPKIIGAVTGATAAPVPAVAAMFGMADRNSFQSPEEQAATHDRFHEAHEKAANALKSGDYLGVARTLQDLFLGEGLKEPVDTVEDQIGSGNYAGAAGTGLGMMGQFALAHGLGKVIGGAPGAVADKVADLTGTADPFQTMTQAIKPRAPLLKFSKNLADSGMGDAKMGEEILGHPVSSLQDALDAVRHAKRINRVAYSAFGGPNRAEIPVDLTPAADAMESSVPETLKHEAAQGVPSAVADLKNRQLQAQAYRTTVPMSKAESMLKEANAELDAFYAKYPRAQWSTLQTNPETAATYAKAQKLRDAVYHGLDQGGAGEAAREVNRRYGNLIELEEEMQRRQNVAARQQPQSLSEQLSKAQAYGHAALGAGKLLTGNVSGAADIAGAIAQKKIAQWIKEQQSTDAMVKRAFAGYKETSRPLPQ